MVKKKDHLKAGFSSHSLHLWHSIKPEYAINGLRKTGIIPFNPEALSTTTVHPLEVFYNTEPQSQGEMELEKLGGMDSHAMEHLE